MSRKLKAPTRREKYIHDEIKQLQTENEFFLERVKVLEKRFDFIQDEYAKMALEEQALIKGVQIIVDVAHKLMDKQKVPTPKKEEKGDMHGIG